MARKYSFGMGVTGKPQDVYQRTPNNHCVPAPAPEQPKIFRDIGLYLENIVRGKTATLLIEPPAGLQYGDLYPREFVFSGTRDLWLLPTSACDHMCFINEPIPLDTFRPGSPHQISWPRIRPGYSGGRLQLDIENRGRARNESKGTFVGRLNCLVSADEPSGYRAY